MKKTNLLFVVILSSLFLSQLIADSGCTDPYASNYDSDAINDDGNCNYDYPEWEDCNQLYMGGAILNDCGECINGQSIDLFVGFGHILI